MWQILLCSSRCFLPSWCPPPSAAADVGYQWFILTLRRRIFLGWWTSPCRGCITPPVEVGPWWMLDSEPNSQPSGLCDAVCAPELPVGLGLGEISEAMSLPLFCPPLFCFLPSSTERCHEITYTPILISSTASREPDLIENWPKKIDPEKCSVNLKMLNFFSNQRKIIKNILLIGLRK